MQIDYERIRKTMHNKIGAVAICMAAFAVSAAAQTVNNIPKYTSTGTLQGSAIWEVGGNVGIGMTLSMGKRSAR